MTPDEEQAELAVLERVKRTSIWAYVVFAIGVLILRGFSAFVGLTCSAAVTMISFLWLEEILTTILQPSSHLHPRRLTLRALARFVLLGVAISVTIFVARFDAVSVLLGFSVVVVGIIGEAAYSVYRN
ncbi:MAG TPA: hypothetical protein VEO74_11840 [Thermoanaerobaculia bacterium]|nr:hypothetical protein [Thermoanaerobaculia bacterium]